MYARVEVYPKAKKESLFLIGENRFKVMVKEPAERNLANQRVLKMIGQQYEKSPRSVRLVSGHHSRRKIVAIEE